MRSISLLTLFFVTDTLIAAPLPVVSSGFASIIVPRSEDGHDPSSSGANGVHQPPSISLGGTAKLATALTTGYLAFKTFQSQRARDALAKMLGTQRINSKHGSSNPGGEGDGGSELKPPLESDDELLAKIERENGRKVLDRGSTSNANGDRLIQDPSRIKDECRRIKYGMLSGPEKYAYLKDGPERFLEEWDKICGDIELAKKYVETYHREKGQQGETRPAGGFSAFKSVQSPHDVRDALLTKLGAVVTSGQKMAEGRNSFVNLPGRTAAGFHFKSIP